MTLADAAGHASVALELYRRRLHDQGYTLPPLLDEMAAAALRIASDRHEPTTLAGLVVALDGGPVEPLFRTIPEAAKRLGGISSRTVERLVASGELPSVRVGSRRLIRDEDLVAYAASLRGSFRGGIRTKATG